MKKTRNLLLFKIGSGVTFLVLLSFAVVLIGVALVLIDVVNEGLMHDMTIFESEPKEGYAYWRQKSINEALPSWIVCGSIWLMMFSATLYFAYWNGKEFFSGQPKV